MISTLGLPFHGHRGQRDDRANSGHALHIMHRLAEKQPHGPRVGEQLGDLEHIGAIDIQLARLDRSPGEGKTFSGKGEDSISVSISTCHPRLIHLPRGGIRGRSPNSTAIEKKNQNGTAETVWKRMKRNHRDERDTGERPSRELDVFRRVLFREKRTEEARY